jgi:hypothetical protein
MVFNEALDTVLQDVCLDVAVRYETTFKRLAPTMNTCISGAVSSPLQSDQDHAHHQEYHYSRDLGPLPTDQGEVVDWRVLVVMWLSSYPSGTLTPRCFAMSRSANSTTDA